MEIDRFLEIIDILEDTMEPNSPAIELQNSYRRNPYTILMVTILSLRSRDSQTAKVARELFNTIQKPNELLEFSRERLEEIIKPLGMYKKKSEMIILVSKILIERFGGRVPNNKRELLSIKGVGEKTANVVLNSAFGEGVVAVDTHLHRLCNMWGVVDSKSEVESSKLLNALLPREYREKANTILVSFGQTICLPNYPKCEICQVREYCNFKLKKGD